MKKPEQILGEMMQVGSRRSPEYWLGVLAVLCLRIRGERIKCPFPEGSVEFDAYFAGLDRGHAVWRTYREGAPA